MRQGLLLIVLLGACGLLRGAYWYEMRGEFPSRMEHWRDTDMRFFWDWSEVIGEGDLWTDRELHPFHTWHGQVADRETWSEWYGGKAFHQAPLYPYVLAFVRFGLGWGREGVGWLQVFLGLATILLVYRMGSILRGPPAGLLAAGLFGLCVSPLFHETLLLRATLLTFLHSAVILAGAAALRREERIRPFLLLLLGGLCGALILTRPNALLLFTGVMALLLVRGRREWKRAASRALLCSLGVGLVSVPVVVRNVRVGVPPFSLSSVGAVTLTMGSAGDVSGMRLELSRSTESILKDTKGELLPTFVSTLKTHPDWRSYCRQLGRKFVAFFQAFESPDNGNLHFVKSLSRVLKFTLPFGFVAALGLFGLGLRALFSFRIGKGREGREEGGEEAAALFWMGLLTLGVLLATALLFYPSARFRQPMIPVLAAFGAWGLSEAVVGIRNRRWKSVSAGALLLVGTGWFVHVGTPWASEGHLRRDDLIAAYDYYRAHGRESEGIRLLEEVAARPAEARVAREVLLSARLEGEEWVAAGAVARLIVELDGSAPLAHYALVRQAEAEGRLSEAAGFARRGLARHPDSGLLHLQLGRLLQQMGQEDRARSHLERARGLGFPGEDSGG